MTGFTVLTDSNVQDLLRNANEEDITQFADILLETFRTYSTQGEAEYQPHRANVTRDTGQITLFMPSTTTEHVGVKVVGLPGAQPKGQKSGGTLEATMLLGDAVGKAIGVLNAAELTAFRTSLGAMLLFRRRSNVKRMVMFGSGKQAFWHLRLAAILRGADIETITIVNRSKPRAAELAKRLLDDRAFRQHPHIQISTLAPSDPDYDTHLESTVKTASTIHCAVPSKKPLFPATWLTSTSTSTSTSDSDSNPGAQPRQDPYISAIGSYTLDMQELDPQLLRDITASRDAYVPEGRPSPVIVVDSRSSCFAEAGELVAAAIKEDQVLEIGELAELTERSRETAGKQEVDEDDKLGEKKKEKELNRWLESGLVVYKSVGVGVMDICMGTALIDLAKKKGVGVTLPDF